MQHRVLCELSMCSCPKGAHAWDAIQGEDNHIFPHDPSTEWRTEAYLKKLREDTEASRQRFRDMGIEPW